MTMTSQALMSANSQAPARFVLRDEAAPERMAYTVNAALHALSIGRTKFYELINNGDLKTVTIGGRRLVPRSELERLTRVDRQEAA